MAIKENELRVGSDYIFTDEGSKQRALDKDDLSDVDSLLCVIEPIPHTPEILEKCGFETVTRNEDGTYNFWSKELDASIDYEDENLFRYRIYERLRTKNITSLHQLQNLYLDLTGEELTVNFKK